MSNNLWFITKDGKYITRGKKLTENFNMANLYDSIMQAEKIADEIGGEVIEYKRAKWVVVKDGMYLSNNKKYVTDIKKAYYFNKSTAEQYAQELKGSAVQVLSSTI
jgi:hypothetical protein